MPKSGAPSARGGASATTFCLPAPQEFRSLTRGSRDIRKSYTNNHNTRRKDAADTATSSSSTGSPPAARRRPQHLMQDRTHQLPSSEPIYLDLLSANDEPPASRSERIRRRFSGNAAESSSSSSPSSTTKSASPSSDNKKNSVNDRSIIASMETPWWKRGSASSSTTRNNQPTTLSAKLNEHPKHEQIFYVAEEDGGSVMTGMSQQELLRKKARTESKKRTRLFGNKKKKKKNPIVSLPPGLLAKDKEEMDDSMNNFYSSSSMPSSILSPKQQSRSADKDKNKSSAAGARAAAAAADASSPQSSSSDKSWKRRWGAATTTDEKGSDTTAESTYTDSIPTVQRNPSLETPYSAVPVAWGAAMNETEGESFLDGKGPQDDHCSIDEYSFPLLSTDALGGIAHDADHQKQQQQQQQQQYSNYENSHQYSYREENRDLDLAPIPESHERDRINNMITPSRSDDSRSRVRFAATAELSTIVPVDEETGASLDTEESDFRSTSYLSYQIDLQSPTSVADILNKSSGYQATPMKRRRKPQPALSPVRSILRPGRYGDRNGNEMGGLKKAYVRAISYIKASQILRPRRPSFEEDEVFMPNHNNQRQSEEDLFWVPAVGEEDAVRFVDPSGHELSPIREFKSESASDANSRSEDWSEYEESETMQRLHFIEAVAAVVIQTAYRRHRATKKANELRHELVRGMSKKRNYEKHERNVRQAKRGSVEAPRSPPRVQTVLSCESEGLESMEQDSQNPCVYAKMPQTPKSPRQSEDVGEPALNEAEASETRFNQAPPSPKHFHEQDKSDDAFDAKADYPTSSSKDLRQDPSRGSDRTVLGVKTRSLFDESHAPDMREGEAEKVDLPHQTSLDANNNSSADSTVSRNSEMVEDNSMSKEYSYEDPRNTVRGKQSDVAEGSKPPVQTHDDVDQRPLQQGRYSNVLITPVPSSEDAEQPRMQEPSQRHAMASKGSWGAREGPFEPKGKWKNPPVTSLNRHESATISPKMSFADSVSELTTDKAICIEEPRRKSVSEFINDMETEGHRKLVPDKVVHTEGRSVRIFTSNTYEETQPNNSPMSSRELASEDHSEQSRESEDSSRVQNHWRKSWTSQTEQPRNTNIIQKSKSDGIAKNSSVSQSRTRGGLPLPSRKLPKKEDSSMVSTVASETSRQETGLPVENEPRVLRTKAAVKLQSVFRGFWVRDCINVDHYCAMVIQKAFRGYMCRVNYQYDRYRVVLVQSVWRRSIARSDIAHILACIILVQAAIRGALAWSKRKAMEKDALLTVREKAHSALMIQSAWRRFWAETLLIRTLVDVLIAQSIARGWLAKQTLKRLKAAKMATNEHLMEGTGNSKFLDQVAMANKEFTLAESECSSSVNGVEVEYTRDFSQKSEDFSSSPAASTAEKEAVSRDVVTNAESYEPDSPTRSTDQKGSRASSPTRSTASTESSIPGTPPSSLARVTQTRSASAPFWPPSSSVRKKSLPDLLAESAFELSRGFVPGDESEEEDEPGPIPAVKRLSNSLRDGRPPVAPIRAKTSKLAEKYETGLRQAEKDRKDTLSKYSIRSGTQQKCQVIPPVDVEDSGTEDEGSTADEEGPPAIEEESSGFASQECGEASSVAASEPDWHGINSNQHADIETEKTASFAEPKTYDMEMAHDSNSNLAEPEMCDEEMANIVDIGAEETATGAEPNMEDDSSSIRLAEIGLEKKARTEEAKNYTDSLPDSHPYKEFYEIWGSHGLLSLKAHSLYPGFGSPDEAEAIKPVESDCQRESESTDISVVDQKDQEPKAKDDSSATSLVDALAKSSSESITSIDSKRSASWRSAKKWPPSSKDDATVPNETAHVADDNASSQSRNWHSISESGSCSSERECEERGSVSDSPSQDVVAKQNVIVLVSKQSFDRAAVQHQKNAVTILESKGINFVVLDGADPANKEARNELFSLSKLRGKYPQFFTLGIDGTKKFWGDMDTFNDANEAGSLKTELGGRAKSSDAASSSQNAPQQGSTSTVTNESPPALRGVGEKNVELLGLMSRQSAGKGDLRHQPNTRDSRKSPNILEENSSVPKSVHLGDQVEIYIVPSEDDCFRKKSVQQQPEVSQSVTSTVPHQRKEGRLGTYLASPTASSEGPYKVVEQEVGNAELLPPLPKSIARDREQERASSVSSPTSLDSGNKSVVVYPAGFQVKSSRTKQVGNENVIMPSNDSDAAEFDEKKDSDSLPCHDRTVVEEKPSKQDASASLSESKSMFGEPRSDSTQREPPLPSGAEPVKPFPADDPFFEAYCLWHKKGLLLWKPVRAGATTDLNNVSDK